MKEPKWVDPFRSWQKRNPEWQLICDIPNTDHLYVNWSELSKRERMSWIGKFGSSAKDAWEEFGDRHCKVPCKVLDENMEMHNPTDWPPGDAMTIYKTSDLDA